VSAALPRAAQCLALRASGVISIFVIVALAPYVALALDPEKGEHAI
jgi:hypothetical protein